MALQPAVGAALELCAQLLLLCWAQLVAGEKLQNILEDKRVDCSASTCGYCDIVPSNTGMQGTLKLIVMVHSQLYCVLCCVVVLYCEVW